MDEHAEISVIETPACLNEAKSPQKGMKSPQTKPGTNYKTALTAKNLFPYEPSPSVLVKKRPSPKPKVNDLATPKTVDVSSPKSARPQRSVRRKRIVYSDDESDKENLQSDWSNDSSYSDGSSESDLLTDDDSDSGREKGGDARTPRSARGKKVRTASTRKRTNKKANKNGLVYLDLSSEEVVQVDENFHANVPEDDLANITQKFLETDLNGDE